MFRVYYTAIKSAYITHNNNNNNKNNTSDVYVKRLKRKRDAELGRRETRKRDGERIMCQTINAFKLWSRNCYMCIITVNLHITSGLCVLHITINCRHIREIVNPYSLCELSLIPLNIFLFNEMM